MEIDCEEGARPPIAQTGNAKEEAPSVKNADNQVVHKEKDAGSSKDEKTKQTSEKLSKEHPKGLKEKDRDSDRDKERSEHKRDDSKIEHKRDDSKSEHKRDDSKSEHRRDDSKSEHKRDDSKRDSERAERDRDDKKSREFMQQLFNFFWMQICGQLCVRVRCVYLLGV
jgi:hypothetical protein